MIRRVTGVRRVKSMISIGITRYDPNTAELPQLILNSAKRQPSLTHQFAHIPAVVRPAEQRSQNLRSHFWEQNIQQRHLGMHHASSKLDCLKQSSSRRENGADSILKLSHSPQECTVNLFVLPDLLRVLGDNCRPSELNT